jgi:imidazolonepropionase-like amidohydrolase
MQGAFMMPAFVDPHVHLMPGEGRVNLIMKSILHVHGLRAIT